MAWLATATRGAWTEVDGGLSNVSVGEDGTLFGTNSAQASGDSETHTGTYARGDAGMN